MEIRPVRTRDVVLGSDALVLLGMLAGFFFFAVFLVIVLVFDPPFLAVALWAVLAAAVEHRASGRGTRVADAHMTPPPGSAA